jgi:hypothetical protein
MDICPSKERKYSMQRILVFFCMLVLCVAPAYAAAIDACPDLTMVQRWAGYLSWMGLLKTMGAAACGVGVIYIFWGAISWLLANLFTALREVLDVLAHIVSFALIAAGTQFSEQYRLWPLLTTRS